MAELFPKVTSSAGVLDAGLLWDGHFIPCDSPAVWQAG
jgi:hypothetical protein